MDIIIANTSDMPIYEQVYKQIKDMIVSGELKEGEFLPSIRGLAKDLRISVITTKRAYDELEKDGFINTIASKGSVVASCNLELLKEENLKKIESHLQSISDLCKISGISRDDLLEMLNLLDL